MKYKFLHSTKFWTLVGDFVFGGLALGLSYIADPVAFTVASYVVGGLQPIVFLVIAEMFVADSIAIRAAFEADAAARSAYFPPQYVSK